MLHDSAIDYYGKRLATSSSDSTVKIINIGGAIQPLPAACNPQCLEGGNHKSSVNSIAWAPYELGLCLACGSSDGSISVMTMRPDGGWDTATIERAHPVDVMAVSWAPATALGSIVGSGELAQRLVSGGFNSVIKSTIASASEDGKVVIWTKGKEGDKWEGKVMHNFEAPAWRVSWSLTGNILSVAVGDGDTTLWKEASDGQWEKVTKVKP
ncbi:hypothetical protein ABZP36_004539 [Zizania latifolia]